MAGLRIDGSVLLGICWPVFETLLLFPLPPVLHAAFFLRLLYFLPLASIARPLPSSTAIRLQRLLIPWPGSPPSLPPASSTAWAPPPPPSGSTASCVLHGMAPFSSARRPLLLLSAELIVVLLFACHSPALCCYNPAGLPDTHGPLLNLPRPLPSTPTVPHSPALL